jgi:multidrug resistance efflux pump
MKKDKDTSQENPEKQEDKKSQDKIEDRKPGSIKKVTYVVLLISVLFFIWYVAADRHTPYTDQGRVQGLITPVSPRVSGFVTDVRIQLHTQVKAGDTLIQLDRRPFEIAVSKAEAGIDNAVQSIAASSASVKSSAGRLGVARAQLDRAERNWNRVQQVMKENEGALSAADKDQAETAYLQAVEQVASAEAGLERAQQQLGIDGPENPKIRTAVQTLEQAQLDLEFSTIVAPTDGFIESFEIDLGYYASAGQPLTTLISSSDVWIQANLKENNLSQMSIGDEVEFILDIAPGRVFKGKVRSMGFGVSTNETNKGGLPTISQKKGWLQDPQRFPVIISSDEKGIVDLYRLGGQVDIVVYTGNNFILNSIAAFKIRLMSYLSYVR